MPTNSKALKISTKAEEMDAVEKIRKILESIGGDTSYVGKALEGCLDIAVNNIEHDFWISLKDNYEHAKNAMQEAEKQHQTQIENVTKQQKEAVDELHTLYRKKEEESKILLDDALETVSKQREKIDCAASFLVKYIDGFRQDVTGISGRLDQKILRCAEELSDANGGDVNRAGQITDAIKELALMKKEIAKLAQSADGIIAVVDDLRDQSTNKDPASGSDMPGGK